MGSKSAVNAKEAPGFAWVLLVLAFRAATGQHLDGRGPRSDATFRHRGTQARPTHWSANPWWPRLAGWERAVIMFWAPAVLGWCLLFHRAATERATAVACGVALGCGLILAAGWWEVRVHYRTVVKPLHGALAAQPALRALPVSAVDIPKDYKTREDAEIVVDVGPAFTGAQRDMEDMTRAITVKTGFPSPKVTLALDSDRPRVIYAKGAPPPLLVTSGDVMPDILAAPRFTLVLGKGQKGRDGKYPVERTSVRTDTPHTGLGMASQEGKSTAAMNLGCQMARQGAILLVLDYKMLSHMWADGLPNVSYAYTPEMIHELLVWLGWDDRDSDGNIIRASELTRRKRVGRASGDIHGNVTADLGPPLFILAEELNATQRQLRNYWRQIGGKGPSPASWVLDEVAFTGAALDVFALYIAQRLGARSSGSDGSRDAMENIGCFILKDPPPQTWNIVAAGHAQPPASGHKGRYQKVTRKEVTEFQGVLWAPEDARAFAMSGTVAVPRFDMPFVNHAASLVPAAIGQGDLARHEGPEQAFVVGHDDPVLPAGEGPQRAVTIAQAVVAGFFTSKAAGRKAAQRRGWKPVVEDPVNGNQYALEDLAAYKRREG